VIIDFVLVVPCVVTINHPPTATKLDNLHKIAYHPYTLTLQRVPMNSPWRRQ